MSDGVKKSDQIKMLDACRVFTDTGEWEAFFCYPACGYHLVQLGLVTVEKQITPAGRFALWVLNKGDDPIPNEHSFVSINLEKL